MELALRRLTAGTMGCPAPRCEGTLYRDGHARLRRIRMRGGGVREVRPQRVRCRCCRRGHNLSPAWCVPGRGCEAEVVGVALSRAAEGHGHRPIAAELGLPESTVRGWLRAVRGHAPALRAAAIFWSHRLGSGDLDRVAPAGSVLGDAVAELALAAQAARRFFGAAVSTTVWEFIVLLTGGRLLRPRHLSG